MDELNNNRKYSMLPFKIKRIKKYDNGVLLAIFIFTLSITLSNVVQAEEKPVVAVLPFTINSQEPIDNLNKELQKMLTDSINNKGLSTLDPMEINQHGKAFQSNFLSEELINIGKELNTDWIIQGSLTHIRRKISIDIKIVDIKTMSPPLFLYMIEDDLDNLSNITEQAATSIYNQITGAVQLDAVEISGNRRIENDAIFALIQSRKGEKLDNDKLDKDLRSIYSMGFFTNVAIETEDGPSGKIVTFIVTEKPSINEISFEGNKKIKDKDLSQETGVEQYSILNPSEIKQSINRLKDFYRLKGYYNVEITEKIEPQPRNEVSLTYVIEEGKVVHIREIDIIGNEVFEDDDLKDIMDTKEKGLLSLFTKSGLLDQKKLEFDVNKIVAFYNNHGFIRIQTGEPKITHNKEKDGLVITIQVIEGPQYTVNSAKVSGDMVMPENALITHVSIHRQEHYNREVVRQDILKIKDIYGDEGYAYTEVIPVTDENDEHHYVDITYNIKKNKKIRFERINITGNSNTADHVIRRELNIIEGDFFSGSRVRQSSENLYRLGYFQDMDIDTKRGSQDDLVIMDIDVKEQPTGSLGAGVGYSSFDSAVVNFKISENNLFGKGQKLSASANLGGKSNVYDISFTEPWLFGTRLSAGFDIYDTSIEYDDYTKDSFGGALRFGFPIKFKFDLPLKWGEHLKGSIRYTYENTDVSDVSEWASTVIRDMEGNIITSSATFGISRDSRDKPWFTTKGSFNSLSYEYAGGILGGDSGFDKFNGRSAWYFPLFWKTAFMLQGRAGYVTQKSDGTLPVYEKFVLGGLNSVRGYEYGSISPLDPETGDKIGGTNMWVCNLEFIFPLVEEAGVRGVIFFDAGNVYDKDEDWDFSKYSSIGGGIRWLSPVGPLRLEYGYKLDQIDGEPSGNFEFNIGGSF